MRGGVIHHASGVRSPKPLIVRGGLVRTFGSLAGFLVVIFLCVGLYILQDAFANPLAAEGAALISAAFIITLAAMLLFFLIRPRERLRTRSHVRVADFAAPAVKPLANLAPPGMREDRSRTLAYQRFYVDHSRIRQ